MSRRPRIVAWPVLADDTRRPSCARRAAGRVFRESFAHRVANALSTRSGCDTDRRSLRQSSTARQRCWYVRSRARPLRRTRSYIRQCFHCRLVTRHRVSGFRLELLQPLLLLAPAEVHPELQDQRAIVGQRLLERGDLGEAPSNSRAVDAAIARDRAPAPSTTSSGTSRRGRAAAGRASTASSPAARAPPRSARRRPASQSTADPSTRSTG